MANDRGYYQFTRSEMLPFLPEHYGPSLEIGCGEGRFSAQLAEGVETWGVEIDANAAAVAANHMSRVLHGRFDEIADQLPDNYFGLVICNDVIEHVADHDTLLETIKRKLVPGGALVASIPNIRHFRFLYELLFKKDWRYRDAGVLDRTHLRFFTEKSLRRTLAEHGFQVELLYGINRPSRWRRALKPIAIGVLTLGYFWDIQYQQFGLRARKPA